MTLRAFVPALLLALLCSAVAAADSVSDAASRVLAAHRKGPEALAALPPAKSADPWMVVDELLHREAGEAARAYAERFEGRDTEALPAYIEEYATKSVDAESRAALDAAVAAFRKKDWAATLADLERPSPRATPVMRVRFLNGRAKILAATGNLEAASAAWFECTQLVDGIGWLNEASGASQRAALAAYRHGQVRRAREIWQVRLEIERKRGSKRGEAAALGNLGLAHSTLGNLQKALSNMGRARDMLEAEGRKLGYAQAMMNIGLLHRRLGDVPRALEQFEEAQRLFVELGNLKGELSCAANIASTLTNLGESDRARAIYKEAIARARQANQVTVAAHMFTNAAVTEINEGRFTEGHALLDRGQALFERLGERLELATVFSMRADAFTRESRLTEAVDAYRRSLSLAEKSGDRRGRALTHAELGYALLGLNRREEAREQLEHAVRLAERMRTPLAMLKALGALSHMQLKDGDARAAVATARRAVPYFERLVRGHAQRHGARERELNAACYRHGALAAAVLEDADEACFFLESGRAGTLLERMGGVEALSTTLPDELVEERALARSRETKAQQAYDEARAGGDLQAGRAASKALDEALAAVQVVSERIQRYEKKHAAHAFVYPTAATLEEIQGRLAAREGFVTYGVFRQGGMALVVTRRSTRVVSLGPSDPIVAACAALQLEDPQAPHEKQAEALRKLVVTPLALEPGLERVLLSPNGPLSYVPGAILFPGKEVVFQPSATTYGALFDDRPSRGRRVLGLGDPKYARAAGGGSRLPSLPATRLEVEAIADVKLLSDRATRADLESSLAAQPGRWRAVHLACHGVVDTERPLLSSLALTAGEHERGRLYALDVFRMRIPADLAVLSACETGRGRIFKAEGIVGLTRAFMCAGAPSVLCSLWKVDDEATRALMVKFYELWNPRPQAGPPARPLSAAAALMQAQAHVRAQPKWKHPYFWAAWVLWGLP